MVQTLRRVHWTPTRLAILLLGSVTIALELVGFIRNIPAVHPKPVAGDFGAYYAAAVLQRDRPQLLYDHTAQDEVAQELGMASVGIGYIYLPFFATLLQPFTLFDLPNAARLWIALCLAALLASAHLLLKVARVDARLPFTLLAFGLALIFPPVVTDLIYGNVNILFLLMLTAAVYLLDKTPAAPRRDLFAGMLIGVTIVFKFYPALLLIPIAAARRWRVIAGSIAGVGAAIVIGLLGANGIANTVRYISGGAPAFIIPWEPFNQSLVGALRRLFEPYLYTFPVFELGNLVEMQAQPLVNAPALVMPLFILLAVVVFAVTLYALWRMSSAVPLRLKIALFLSMAFLLTPLLWEYYAVLLLLPFAIWLSFHDRFDTSLLMVTVVTFVLTLHRYWKPLALLGVPFWALSFGLLAIFITWGYTLYAAKHLGD